MFDFTFSPEEMKQLDALNKNLRFIVPMLTVSVYHPPESGNVRFRAAFWPSYCRLEAWQDGIVGRIAVLDTVGCFFFIELPEVIWFRDKAFSL